MAKRPSFTGMRGKKAPFNGMRGKKSISNISNGLKFKVRQFHIVCKPFSQFKKFLRKIVFATNSIFLIPISLRPNDVNL